MVEMSMYSIGSAAFLREVFNGLAMITGTGDFVKAVMIGMLFSTIVVCFQAILRGGREIAWQNILLGWILYGMFFAVPARVVVEDTWTGEVFTVDNVPLGAAASGFMISRVGHGLTDLLETGYGQGDREDQLPYLSALQYLLWAERIAEHDQGYTSYISNAAKVDIRQTLNEYLRNCVVPTIDRDRLPNSVSPGNQKILELLEIGSKEINTYSAIFKFSGNSTSPDTQPCNVVYEEIKNVLMANTSQEKLDDYLKGLSKDWRNPSGDPAFGNNEQINTAIMFDRMHIYAQERQELMIATIVRPIFYNAFREWHARNQMVADLMVDQATMQRNFQWVTEQTLWAQVVHPLMTFFEGFIYAITPFVALLLCMGSMGFSLIGRYLQVLFWISLWMPIMSIGNLYLELTTERLISGINFSTMNGAATIIPQLQNQIAVGGMLMTATPMLALFVVTGSNYAFTTLVSRLNGSDHINEKMMAPDVLNVGGVVKEADLIQANTGSAGSATGTENNIGTVNFGEAASHAESSSDQTMHSTAQNWTKAIARFAGLDKFLSSKEGYNQSWSTNLMKNLQNMDAATRNRVIAAMDEALFSVGGKAGATGSGGFDSSKLEGAKGLFGKIVGSLGIDLSAVRKQGVSEQARADLAKTMSLTTAQAQAETFMKQDAASIDERWGKGVTATNTGSAQRVIQTTKSHNVTSSVTSTAGLSQNPRGNEVAQTICRNPSKLANFSALTQEAYINGRLDHAKVDTRTKDLMSSGFVTNPLQARATAELEQFGANKDWENLTRAGLIAGYLTPSNVGNSGQYSDLREASFTRPDMSNPSFQSLGSDFDPKKYASVYDQAMSEPPTPPGMNGKTIAEQNAEDRQSVWRETPTMAKVVARPFDYGPVGVLRDAVEFGQSLINKSK